MERKRSALGLTTLFGQYANGEDPNTIIGTNTYADIDVWGVGINQQINAAAMDIYLVYKNFDASSVVNGVNQQLDDIDIVYTGAIIRF